MCLLFAKGGVEDQEVEEEEAEGEEVEEIIVGFSSGAKRQNLIVMMTVMVSSSFRV